MTTYNTQAPSGLAGNITREANKVVETVLLDSTKTYSYGQILKMVSGKAVPLVGGDTASVVYGAIVRTAPVTNYGTDAEAVPLNQPAGVMIKGYMNVVCKVGTPVRGGIVYSRIVAASGKVIGDYEATADGVNSVAVGIWAVDGKDSANNAEIFIK